ncbi:ABC transporter ATP-binding protein [Phaeodactylibacter sp.]|jgi:ABC-type polysaccharide/polyol phosphate transport system ATPase subunit|uniref:ABC transporter ATP-binding protein n=1 Tax=Phaeodactylibacter sp. TaxID=1940289 RepID=UPI0025D56511|nr:ABC transporter ATP-binding protein [Phaeodactylibacter sp.]MCI4647041.1 ABC transporter ATP-binding protein [Phaeodactylibacter sp.]MCI5090655.1 ABC transporter ATP-binding protein [Phaeodactylibacter sp.]
MIQVDNLGKKFGIRQQSKGQPTTEKEVWAIRQLSFTLPKGKALGLIGPNGAGKSTLLKILAGIYLPTCGQAILSGQSGAVLDIGSGFHPDLTGRENIKFAGRLAGLTKEQLEAALPEIIAFSELEEHLDTPVKYYSSGMFLRLAFSTLIHTECEILLFDEVLAVGDSAFQEKCFQKIQSLKQDGRTMIMASHEPAKLAQFCDEVMVMANGACQFLGPAQKALSFYSKHFALSSTPQPRDSRYLEQLTYEGATVIGELPNEEIAVTFTVKLKVKSHPLTVAIALTDSLNQLLFSGHQPLVMENVNANESMEVQWSFPKSHLNEGLFWVNFYLFEEQNIVEQLPKVGQLEIPPYQDPKRNIEGGFHAIHIDSQIQVSYE